MCEETVWEGDKDAVLCAGFAAVYFNTDLSKILKKKQLPPSRNKGYTEIACVLHRPLSSKKCLFCVFQGFGVLRKYSQ